MSLGVAAAGQAPCVLVLPHTHWDREWYHLAGRFRQRLVALVDDLLDRPIAGVPSFLLDGQAIAVEDYLAVRPERRADLAAALRERRIEAGPWYVLADELIPSGEALVRNLLHGRRVLRELGATPPPVLYSPDAFGHPAALPLLAEGFGARVAVVWRGYGGARWPEGDTARWYCGESEVLLWHLPPSGYEHGSELPSDEHAMRERWSQLGADLVSRARLQLLVVMAGADHHARAADLGDAVDALRRVAAPAPVRAVSLQQLAEELECRAREVSLPRIEGELRNSTGYVWSLQGTFAVRAMQKRRNAQLERLLTREVEPWCAAAWRRGAWDRGALVRAAWTMLLQCHPHDTLCGCSVDGVARAMDARLDDVEAQARGLLADVIADLADYDPAAARRRHGSGRSVCIVRNAAARPRSGVAELELLTFRRHVPVGPGTDPEAEPERPAEGVSLDGVAGPVQRLARTVRQDRIESPLHYPDDDLVDARRVLAWVDDVPAYGLRALAITTVEGDGVRSSTAAAGVAPVRCTPRSLDNGLVRVLADDHGTVMVHSAHAPDRPVRLAFEDVGDAGDLYTHSPVPPVIIADAAARVTLAHAGPLRGVLVTEWELDLPATSSRSGRATERASTTLRVELSVDAGSSFARVRMSGVNSACDHRLRLLLHTGIAAPRVVADAAFATVERPVAPFPTAPPAGPAAPGAEHPVWTMPLARWLVVTGERRAVAVVTDGLCEGEVRADGAAAITLLRCVGELSRGDLPERPGHAGWPAHTPDAQMLRPFEAELAVIPAAPHPGEAHAFAQLDALADEVLLPLRGWTLRDADVVPGDVHGVHLTGDDLVFSASKRSDDGAWLVLRCGNRSAEERTGAWRIPGVVSEARQSRLDETPGEPVACVAHGALTEIPITVPAHGTATILVR
ncbi:MAG TPA: hypothetical protein VFK13_13575 [Gemmatimonadaceae bacterium]|nr:hypothetical protein [Gemmatimonadaceae bacterium]